MGGLNGLIISLAVRNKDLSVSDRCCASWSFLLALTFHFGPEFWRDRI
jgi:hypothetical protein